MHFSTAYYLTLLYLAVMFKPLVPIISDAYAHAFDESMHLSTVHAKYGSHHLEKSLAKESSGETNGENQKNLKPDDTSGIHIGSALVSYRFTASVPNRQYRLFCYRRALCGYSAVFSPPPDITAPVL